MSRNKKKKGCLNSFIIVGVILTFAVFAVLGGIFVKELKKEIQEQKKIPYQEVKIQEEQLTNKYYYELLSEEEQKIYKELLQGMLDGAGEIYLHGDNGETINRIVAFVLNDYPEIFWCDGSGETTTYQQEDVMYSIFVPEYQYHTDERKEKNQQILNAAETFLASAPVNGTEYEKIKYVYEYLIEHTHYKDDASDNQNIYSVLVNGESVCAGYARTTQYLLEKLGVFCTYVTGTALDPETNKQNSHAWNIVLCDGEYYHVDTTWGDPLYLQEIEETENSIVYDFLCVNDEELFRTHTIDSTVQFPTCTSLKYNYYVLNGTYYAEYNQDQILQAMKNSINQKLPDTTFKFANKDLYNEAKENIVNTIVKRAAEYLCDYYGLSQVNYSWQQDDAINRLTVYWEYQ